jgi:NAD(P)-dependent dehydrogenase (short-subunit alcohol dehydrogenase family)
MELTGRRVLITGASRGIGAGLASSFAAVGARVVLAARSERPIKELASSLEGSAHAIDLSDADALAGFVARVEAADGPIDVLVNNAGMAQMGVVAADADVEALDIAEWRRQLEVSLTTALAVTQAVVALGKGRERCCA